MFLLRLRHYKIIYYNYFIIIDIFMIAVIDYNYFSELTIFSIIYSYIVCLVSSAVHQGACGLFVCPVPAHPSLLKQGAGLQAGGIPERTVGLFVHSCILISHSLLFIPARGSVFCVFLVVYILSFIPALATWFRYILNIFSLLLLLWNVLKCNSGEN